MLTVNGLDGSALAGVTDDPTNAPNDIAMTLNASSNRCTTEPARRRAARGSEPGPIPDLFSDDLLETRDSSPPQLPSQSQRWQTVKEILSDGRIASIYGSFTRVLLNRSGRAG